MLSKAMLHSHGARYRLITKGAGIEVLYADGIPMSFADVRIFAPGKKKIYQKGLTDRMGRFMFSPEYEGEWKILVSDRTGHGIKTKLSVDKNRLIKKSRFNNSFPLFYKLLTGLSLIFGITGMLMYFSLKWKNKEKGRN